jgi:hypothetical protein
MAHWARNVGGQSRMLLAAMRGEVARQYPGGDAQRGGAIEAGAARPARLIRRTCEPFWICMTSARRAFLAAAVVTAAEPADL